MPRASTLLPLGSGPVQMSASARSTRHLCHCAKLLGCCRAVAEEFEIGRDLLEEHVGADLEPASARGGGFEKRCHLAFHDHLAYKGFAIEPGRIDGKRVTGFHPERRRVDHEVVADGVVAANFVLEQRLSTPRPTTPSSRGGRLPPVTPAWPTRRWDALRRWSRSWRSRNRRRR